MSVAGAIRSWWSDRRAERDFHDLPEAERSANARDLRLSEDLLDRIVDQAGGAPLLLPELLGALQLDQAKLTREHPGVMRDLELTCAGCGDKARCHRDLDRRKAAESYADYCPNTATLDALLAGAREEAVGRTA